MSRLDAIVIRQQRHRILDIVFAALVIAGAAISVAGVITVGRSAAPVTSQRQS